MTDKWAPSIGGKDSVRSEHVKDAEIKAADIGTAAVGADEIGTDAVGLDELSAAAEAAFAQLGVAQTFTQKQTFGGEIEIDGDLNHDGVNAGVYGVPPVPRPAAYTQTYATADKVHANPTQTAVAATAATNVTPFGFTTAAQADDIRAQVNNARLDILDLKQLVNALIDDLQSQGWLQ